MSNLCVICGILLVLGVQEAKASGGLQVEHDGNLVPGAAISLQADHIRLDQEGAGHAPSGSPP